MCPLAVISETGFYLGIVSEPLAFPGTKSCRRTVKGTGSPDNDESTNDLGRAEEGGTCLPRVKMKGRKERAPESDCHLEQKPMILKQICELTAS